MPVIRLITEISAPLERCFDLSRSIDLHKISTAHTREEAIDGVVSGTIGLGESVTWRARHLGMTRTLTTKITEYERPYFFADEMIAGAFKRFRHEHLFESRNGSTLMTDIFDYTAPYGILGKVADFIFLRRYMERLLQDRNRVIKEFAESERWKEVIKETTN